MLSKRTAPWIAFLIAGGVFLSRRVGTLVRFLDDTALFPVGRRIVKLIDIAGPVWGAVAFALVVLGVAWGVSKFWPRPSSAETLPTEAIRFQPAEFTPAIGTAHRQMITFSVASGLMVWVGLLVLERSLEDLLTPAVVGAVIAAAVLAFLELRLLIRGGIQRVKLTHQGVEVSNREGAQEIPWSTVWSVEERETGRAIALVSDGGERQWLIPAGHRRSSFERLTTLVAARRIEDEGSAE